MSETQDIAMPFTADFDIKKPFKITNQLLASDSPAAQAEENARHHSKSYASHKSSQAMRVLITPRIDVRPICTLTTNLEPIRHLFEKKTTTKGSSFCHVPFELLMQIHSAQITFKFRYNGVEYGNITTADFS